MKEAWRYARAYALVFICMMFLGAGMKTQAAGVPPSEWFETDQGRRH